MTDPEKKQLGRRLQAWRLAAGLSQSQLAKASGVPVGTIRNLEVGRREPGVGIALKLATACKVRIDKLLTDMPPTPAGAKA